MMPFKKIAHLTSVHPRFDSRIFMKECKTLVNADFSVSLVVADGLGDEVSSGVNIYDVGKRNGRFKRIFLTTRSVYDRAVLLDADLYHFHDPELIPVGLKLKKLGKKVIFDIHEMTSIQIQGKKWIPTIFRKFVSKIYSFYENLSVRNFDYLITPQAEMTEHYSQISPSITIFNYPDHEFSLKCKSVMKYSLIYSGSISEERGLSNLIGLIEELVKLDQRYKLTLACPVTESLKSIVQKSKASDNIILAGYVSFDRLLKLYANSSFGLILFNNVGQYYMANALKLFEYMGAGLFVVMPDFGRWVDFNRVYEAGLTVDTLNYREVADKINNTSIEEIYNASLKNTNTVRNNFSWESQGKLLVMLYEEILND